MTRRLRKLSETLRAASASDLHEDVWDEELTEGSKGRAASAVAGQRMAQAMRAAIELGIADGSSTATNDAAEGVENALSWIMAQNKGAARGKLSRLAQKRPRDARVLAKYMEALQDARDAADGIREKVNAYNRKHDLHKLTLAAMDVWKSMDDE